MSEVAQIKIFLEGDAVVPTYQHAGDAGADVCSIDDTFTLYPGDRKLVRTGIFMELPENIECQVRPRSGLALNNGITVLNSPGTIDSSYRGECNVILINHGVEAVEIAKGMRIGQFVFNKYANGEFIRVDSKDQIAASERGDGGFGHSGV